VTSTHVEIVRPLRGRTAKAVLYLSIVGEAYVREIMEWIESDSSVAYWLVSDLRRRDLVTPRIIHRRGKPGHIWRLSDLGRAHADLLWRVRERSR
jgi:hypothetical protein